LDTSLVIIGPMGVGKSTLAEMLSRKLETERCCVDEKQWEYFSNWEFDQAKARQLIRADQSRFLDYARPFFVRLIEHVLADHQQHIIDFGSGHVAVDDPAHIERVKRAFAFTKHVLLLMPSPSIADSLAALPGGREGRSLNPLFIEHPLKHELATHTIYTSGKSSDQVYAEALTWFTSAAA
jgi:ABC-type branched-subunit amino acid transport system ATPase component